MKARDLDMGDNAVIKYLVLAGNEDKAFNINTDTGLITTSEKLDFERKSEYKLFVAARNLRPFQGPHAADIINPSVEVLIKVKDINDELVVFEQRSYKFAIPENLPRGTLIGALNATNTKRIGDLQDVTYWLEESGEDNAASKFNINPKTGELIVIDTIDCDMPANEKVFNFRVLARDTLSINALNTSVPVRIEIQDEVITLLTAAAEMTEGTGEKEWLNVNVCVCAALFSSPPQLLPRFVLMHCIFSFARTITRLASTKKGKSFRVHHFFDTQRHRDTARTMASKSCAVAGSNDMIANSLARQWDNN